MRWLGWLLKKGMTVVLVSALTLAVTGVVVNAYVQSLLRQFNIQLDQQPIWGLGWLKGSAGTDQSTDTGKNKTTGSGSGSVTPPDDALPVMGQGLEESGSEARWRSQWQGISEGGCVGRNIRQRVTEAGRRYNYTRNEY